MSEIRSTEIISVGTELLLGHVTNTDARDISEMLSRMGINVRYHTVVGDNPGRLAQCVQTAKQRADLIITTGGLGPTCDDLTKQVLAESFGLKLVRDEAEYQGLYDYIHQKKTASLNNLQQAYLPEGCTVFHNNAGTAPGCAFEKDGVTVIMLPGPPKECMAMFRDSAMPYLKQYAGQTIVSHSVHVFGLGESSVDAIFREEMNAMTNPTMAPYAKECDCLVQLTAKAATEEEGEAMLAPLIERVKQRLGTVVFGVDTPTLEAAVLPLLQERGLTFAAAESCTGGDVARRFTELPGASACFAGGAVTYTNEVKHRVLGIPEELIEEKTAVSREVAEQMAIRVRELTGADLGIGITGIAGPGSDGVHEVGCIFVSLADRDRVWVRELHLGTFRTRSFCRQMAGNHAFDLLRCYLTGLPMEWES